MTGRLGASRLGVWSIKHLVAPLHRRLYQATGMGGANILLLTTIGRRTGRARTTPVFYARSGEYYIICNVRPAGERANPWVLNLRADPTVSVQVGSDVIGCRARELVGTELQTHWPQLVALWPAYQQHFERSGERAVFELSPTGRDA